MTDAKPFGLSLAGLKLREKRTDEPTLAALDRAGEAAGFVSREPAPALPVRGRGRPASPRTGQVHAKVLPKVADEIAAEAQRRGVTQGVLIEEAWAEYKARTHIR